MRALHLRGIHGVLAAVVALLLLAAPAVRGQETEPSLVISQVDATGYPQIRSVVTVLDERGVPVPDLPPSAFAVSESGQPLGAPAVESSLAADVPLAVVIVIDTSGSMAEGGRMVAAKAAAVEFVQQLDAQDTAMLLTFDDDVVVSAQFTSVKADLVNAINALVPQGNTALLEAAQTAAFYARLAEAPRKAIVLMSDGENVSNSNVTQEGALAVATDAGIPQYTVAFSPDADASFLAQLAAQTRGQTRVAQPATISEVYNSISTLLRSQYVIVGTAANTADGAPSTLEVVATLDSGVAAASAPFTRGVPVVPPVAPPPADTTAIGDDDESSVNIPLITFSAAIMAALAAIATYFIVRWRRAHAIQQHQLAVVAPNPRQAAAQPLPRQQGAFVGPQAEGPGRLVEQTADGPGAIHQLGSGAAIGSSRRECTIVLPQADDVAPEHVRLWLRDGKYLLHHAGGLRRKTLVGGKEADWVVLEPGDEVVVGTHRFVYEERV